MVNRHTKQQAEALDRQLAALNLRKKGVSYSQIAEQLGYTQGAAAYRAVHAAIKKTLQEPADAVRRLELQRLDDLLLAIQSKVESGDLKAIEVALKLMDRRARYLGLDAPKSIDITSAGDKLSVVGIEIVPPADEPTE